jgi:hypothetical protein
MLSISPFELNTNSADLLRVVEKKDVGFDGWREAAYYSRLPRERLNRLGHVQGYIRHTFP